jgi:hypothetical protein
VLSQRAGAPLSITEDNVNSIARCAASLFANTVSARSKKIEARAGVGSLERSMSVMAFHEKAGRSQVDSLFVQRNKVLLPAELATVAMLPSALSRSESFRSVHVGRSRFSRCCHLFGALWFCSSESNLG